MTCNTVVVKSKGASTVRIAGVPPVPVVLSRDIVAKIDANRPSTAVIKQNTPVNVTERPTDVVLGGQGIQGRPGQPGGSIPPIDFAFGDAAHAVWTPQAAGLLTYARIIVREPFNGTGAAIVVGTLAQPDAAMPSYFNDPKQANEYENTPDIRLAAGESIYLTITPGTGATAGAGTLLLGFLPD